MKQSEAAVLLKGELREYKKIHPGQVEGPAGILLFYTWIQNNRPELLNWRCRGDQYQMMKVLLGSEYRGS